MTFSKCLRTLLINNLVFIGSPRALGDLLKTKKGVDIMPEYLMTDEELEALAEQIFIENLIEEGVLVW